MENELLVIGDLPPNTIKYEGQFLTRDSFYSMEDLQVIKLVKDELRPDGNKINDNKLIKLKGYKNLPDIDIRSIEKELWKLQQFEIGKHEKFMFKRHNSDIKVKCVQIILWKYYNEQPRI